MKEEKRVRTFLRDVEKLGYFVRGLKIFRKVPLAIMDEKVRKFLSGVEGLNLGFVVKDQRILFRKSDGSTEWRGTVKNTGEMFVLRILCDSENEPVMRFAEQHGICVSSFNTQGEPELGPDIIN